ncbi:MAG: hypothetical protein GYB68_16725 [Chloroflexi bacterium]|nr:hypothetical protein [Chloroflexota bacterium]
MCGIIASLDHDIEHGLPTLQHRGPDATGSIRKGRVSLGATRLSIVDPHPRANQPFAYGPITLALNGEIWNYRSLRQQLTQDGHQFDTDSDVEVLAALLQQNSMGAFNRVEGMFAAVWLDERQPDCILLARDRFGEIPLHVTPAPPYVVVSELKALLALNRPAYNAEMLPPGHLGILCEDGLTLQPYYDTPLKPIESRIAEAAPMLHRLVHQAVDERLTGDVSICTLLSGGIDSACIALFLRQHNPDLVAYTAVYDPASADLAAARLLASELEIDLREVSIPAPSLADMRRVVWQIEMTHKAQVEIAWPCLVLAERMAADGFRVVFSGEGSDELWASYGFADEALQTADWHAYRKALLLAQGHKNFARANKVFMAHSIEARLPFLHRPLVEFALSLPRDAVQKPPKEWKAVLQEAFRGHLPDAIVERPKLAFQNGLGIKQAIKAAVGSPRKAYHAAYIDFFGSSKPSR